MSPDDRQARLAFDAAVAYGENRTAIAIALAEAAQAGEARTLPELQQHTDVSATTTRNILNRFEEMGLVTQTQRHGRMAFRLSEKGERGYRAWRAAQAELNEERERVLPRTAPLYRWRVSGLAARSATVDADDVKTQLAHAGADLRSVGEPSLMVHIEFEIDALDGPSAQWAVADVGWRMQLAQARIVGLASSVTMFGDHHIELTECELDTAAESFARLAAEKVRRWESRDINGPALHVTTAKDTIVEFLQAVDAPTGGILPLPDDARLIDALKTLWDEADEAGIRAVGNAFTVSEAELRAEMAESEAELGAAGSRMNWSEMTDRAVDRYRRQGRLRP